MLQSDILEALDAILAESELDRARLVGLRDKIHAARVAEFLAEQELLASLSDVAPQDEIKRRTEAAREFIRAASAPKPRLEKLLSEPSVFDDHGPVCTLECIPPRESPK